MADRDYTTLQKGMDIEEIKPVSAYSVSENFYGGLITHIAKLRNSPVYLLLDMETDGIQVKDVAVETLEELDFNVLKTIALQRGIKFNVVGVSREALIEKIKKVTLVLN